ncbi:cytoplasmic polyadenylation element-binding protein 1-B [Lutzomyia longipalpis]|uniref:cytoplasmic polyadenylation element-binding protein 1-B n=1 Tax=Lutzomyia longipalpis TaxID=7200 RepID=UPI002483877E|nr:cytoplasmic polyadenylation element-binding protein 1-B [Lutzomyia longipalpis]
MSGGSLPVTPTSLQPSLSGGDLSNDPLQLAHLFRGSDPMLQRSMSLETPSSPTAVPRNPFYFPSFNQQKDNFFSNLSSGGSNSPVSDTPGPTLENLIELMSVTRNPQLAALRESQNALNALSLLQLQQQQNALNSPLANLGLLYQLRNLQQLTPNGHNVSNDPLLDYMAKSHRQSLATGGSVCTWYGKLPVRNHSSVTYSTKVFVGGIPWEMSEDAIMGMFRQLGSVRIEWPGKDNRTSRPRGCAYLIFDYEEQVRQLLESCDVREVDGERKYFYRLLPKGKDAEVIPWIVADSTYMKPSSQILDPMTTVFVGALHGKLTAEGLAKIMDELFGGVLYAAIDTDKHKYPMGAGRVTFDNTASYVEAVRAAFIEIKTPKFKKKIQCDPYLEDHLCSLCEVQHGPYFCREISCFKYYCLSCWKKWHYLEHPLYRNHKPMSRNSKSQTLVGIGPMIGTNMYGGFHR